MATQYTAGLTSGQILTAAIMNQIGAVWETWTPAWTSSGTQPVLGNGTREGRYMRIQKLVVAQGYLNFGSTTTYGTGALYTSLPLAMRATDLYLYGYCGLVDASAGYPQYVGAAYAASQTTVEWRIGNAATVWAQGTPITMAASDQMRFTYIYEAA